MKQLIVFTAIIASAAVCATELNFDTYKNGKKIGDMRYQKLLKGDTITIRCEYRYTDGRRMERTDMFDKWGYPISSKFKAKVGKKDKVLSVQFSRNGLLCELSTILKERETTESFKLPPPHGSFFDPSVYWFTTKKPRQEDGYRHYRLDIASLTWLECKTFYTGIEALQHQGKTIQVHRIQEEEGTKKGFTLLDEKAMPVVIQKDDLKFIRTR